MRIFEAQVSHQTRKPKQIFQETWMKKSLLGRKKSLMVKKNPAKKKKKRRREKRAMRRLVQMRHLRVNHTRYIHFDLFTISSMTQLRRKTIIEPITIRKLDQSINSLFKSYLSKHTPWLFQLLILISYLQIVNKCSVYFASIFFLVANFYIFK